jgi:glycoprotein endo-alpha-1,2-mannosidase
MRYPLLCMLALAALGAAGAPVGNAAPPPIVSAFYYPWFATTVEDGSYAHWAQDGHAPPNDIASVYYPALGVYSSDDPTVLDEQMAEIQRAGIDQVAVSWWGRGSPEDQRLPGVIAAASARGIGVAVHIEPYTGRTVASTVSDIAYLETLGIRTFYIYQAFATIQPSAWAAANDALHAQGIVTWADTAFVGQAVAGHFSGVYTYDIVTWNGSKFDRICGEAHRHGLLCAPSVGPGYDARRATGDPHVKPRRDGQTYDSMWRTAIAAGADEITITSFNEWQEGTQIEPAAPPARHGEYSYTSYNGAYGLTGVAAETAYLVRTAHWVAIYDAGWQSRPYPAPT